MIMKKLNKFTTTLQNIQNKYTKIKKAKDDTIIAHPWTRNRQYKVLMSRSKKAKHTYLSSPTNQNKQKLRESHIAASAYYDKLKRKYYQRIISTNGNSLDFYSLMKTKRRSSATFPLMLMRNGMKYFGLDRFDQIAMHLQSCFTGVKTFSENHIERYSQLEAIYDEYVQLNNRNLWDDYVLSFSHEDVLYAINSLKVNKDPGPMGISTAFIQHNLNKLLPIIAQYLSNVLEYGIIPNEWKHSYIVPNT